MNKRNLIISKKQLSDFLFLFSYSIYLIITILSTSFYSVYFPDNLIKISLVVCALILIFKEILNIKLNKKELLFMIICFLLTLIFAYHPNGSIMLPFFIFLYGARNVELKKIGKLSIWITIILFVIIIISAKLGIILDYKSISGDRVRDYLGFRYPLYPQLLLYNIIAIDLYINRENRKAIRFAFWIVINYWLFRYTNSRLSFYLSNLLIILMMMLTYKPKILEKRKIICYMMVLSFVISFILCLYTIANYDNSNKKMYELNKLLENRLLLGKNSLSKYKVNLFGYNVEYIGNGLNKYGQKIKNKGTYNYVDCMYLNLLEKYGLIFIIIFILLLTYVSYVVMKKKNYQLMVILFLIAIHGIIDDLGIYLYYNTFWFTISEYFIKKGEYLK